MSRIRLVSSFLSVILLSATLRAEVGFNRDIRPIMSDTCFRCHGPDKNARMAGLRLDIREEALKPAMDGKIPIVPGRPDQSEIIRRIFSTDSSEIMPPEFSHKTLTQEQKETIRRWVAEGAPYEGHWSFQPVKRPPVPKVSDGGTPIRNPIDAFVQARLAKEGLKPSPEADRRTLIRRVTLDLTGLPPTPTEVEQFVNDKSPDAYEKVVTRLLASPRYAEMQTMHWLDAVRYADTRGFHGDNEQPAWPYRDYVLRAFRDNKPFDEFTREQIAGDLIPNATIEQKVASAYNRILRTSQEGGIQEKEYLAKYGADRVRTTSGVWLGLTTGCAECHDHKFDPIKSKDFYAMKAFFADIKEKGLLPGRGEDAWASTLQLPTEAQAKRLAELNEEVRRAERALEEKTGSLKAREAMWEKQLSEDFKAGRLKWQYQRPFAAKSERGAVLKIYNDELLESNYYVVTRGAASGATKREPGNGTVVASGPNPDNETYTIRFRPGPGTWTALGVQAMQDESLPGMRLARGADRFVLTEVEAELSANEKAPGKKLLLVLATTDGFGEAPENLPMAAIDGNPSTGWGVSDGEGKNPFLALRFAEPAQTTAASVITVRLRHDSPLRRATIGRVRLALSTGRYSWPELGDAAVDAGLPVDEGRLIKGGVRDGVPVDVLKALKIEPAHRSEAQTKALREHFQWSDAELQPLFVKLEQLKASRSLLEAEIPTVLVTQSVAPRETRILPRGNWMDDSGEIVEPAIPQFLGKLTTGGRRATRLDLANWIVSRDNPLTGRVYVNRLWQQFFGTGLSKVLNDLGSQGEWPSHPELLDWLAAEFMEPAWQAEGTHPWDVKHIIRTIVLSHTYRQSSAVTPELEERDPDNRLLARQTRFRVDAEVVHDIALSVSGLLIEKFGGPSVKPYQPEGYWAALNFPKREYSTSEGKNLYRRGVYTHWQRTFLHPTLAAFDAPSREECTVNRVNSNTPLQALVLLNDPIFVEAARVFAQKTIKTAGPTFDKRIDWAFTQALGRKPTATERRILADLHQKTLQDFSASPANAQSLLRVGEAPVDKSLKPVELAAMTVVTRAILNLHETITRN
ncbi:MAG TPA: PSD1 and planctomycete cytochrome C domain-containing protein [Terriglobia bacterium]|nr:PSD1 and planctomycete cytochrome C domain-containing protein [Terriglobia bacterium]